MQREPVIEGWAIIKIGATSARKREWDCLDEDVSMSQRACWRGQCQIYRTIWQLNIEHFSGQGRVIFISYETTNPARERHYSRWVRSDKNPHSLVSSFMRNLAWHVQPFTAITGARVARGLHSENSVASQQTPRNDTDSERRRRG